VTGSSRGEILVVGIGNGLRSDDGVGRHVAEQLFDDPRVKGARVLACHQLTPELAVDVSTASLVVLVDARIDGGPPGTVHVERLETGRAARAPSGSSHGFDPAELIDLTGRLYGPPPPVVLVTVTSGSIAVGDTLSTAVAAAVPEAADAVAQVILDALSTA
jgi:hydrogenase maturation protease